jgi:predicted dehydrogenase
MRYAILAVPFALALLALDPAQAREDKLMRVGIIGLDTSHVVAFTSLLNDPKAKPELAGCKVVAGFPAGSPDIPASKDRVEGFTRTLREKYQVEIVDSIEALLPKVDAVLLESVDGRPHLKQVEPVLKAGKRCFIDKPLAGSLKDAVAIFDLSQKYGVPVFSSSSLRYYPGLRTLRDDPKVGKILGCTTYGPCSLEPHHPDLFWYGVHGVEALFTIMGTGCETVSRTHTEGTDVAVGTWKDGRVGTFRGIRAGKADYGAILFGDKGIVQGTTSGSYEPLVVEIVKYFQTGKVPVAPEETLEIFAFMEGADASKQRGGAAVKLAEVLEAARKK